jgi:hypothetical protein
MRVHRLTAIIRVADCRQRGARCAVGILPHQRFTDAKLIAAQ